MTNHDEFEVPEYRPAHRFTLMSLLVVGGIIALAALAHDTYSTLPTNGF